MTQNEASLLCSALEHPAGQRLFCRAAGHYYLTLLTGPEKEGIPAPGVLPYVLDELLSTGVEPDCLSIVVSRGDAPHSHEDFCALLGTKVASFLRVMDADDRRLTDCGSVRLFFEAAAADFRIGLFVTRAPGDCDGLLARRMAGLASSDSPALTDAEWLAICPIHYAIVTAVDENGTLIGCFCGDTARAIENCRDFWANRQ